MQKIIETCLVCGHKWIRAVARPKRCPACRSTIWFRVLIKKVPKQGIKIDLLPGERRIYGLDKKTIRAIRSAKAKNPRLKITPRAGWVEVEEVRF